MPLCPDCLEIDHILSLMVADGEEVFKGRNYIVLRCIVRGSSGRERKNGFQGKVCQVAQ